MFPIYINSFTPVNICKHLAKKGLSFLREVSLYWFKESVFFLKRNEQGERGKRGLEAGEEKEEGLAVVLAGEQRRNSARRDAGCGWRCAEELRGLQGTQQAPRRGDKGWSESRKVAMVGRFVAVVGRVSGGRLFFEWWWWISGGLRWWSDFLWWFKGGDNGGFSIFLILTFKNRNSEFKEGERNEANLWSLICLLEVFSE